MCKKLGRSRAAVGQRYVTGSREKDPVHTRRHRKCNSFASPNCTLKPELGASQWVGGCWVGLLHLSRPPAAHVPGLKCGLSVLKECPKICELMHAGGFECAQGLRDRVTG